MIGSNFNDTLNAGSVAGVALTGGLGTNTLSGTGAGDSVVESISSSYTLTNAQLTGTGSSFTDNLSGITVATLTGSSPTSNAFTVSGWTGTGSLSAPAGTATVTASKAANYTLTNTLLSSTDGMSLGLSGITTANLTATTAATLQRQRLDRDRALTGASATLTACGQRRLQPEQHLLASADDVAGLERDHDGQPDGHRRAATRSRSAAGRGPVR